MFATLLESRRPVRWSIGNGALSLTAHAAVVSMSIVLTGITTHASDGAAAASVPIERITYAALEARAAARKGAGARVAGHVRRVTTPTAVPDGIPLPIPDALPPELTALLDKTLVSIEEEDLSRFIVRADEFERLGDAGAEQRRRAALAALAAHVGGTPWHATDVERMAIPFDDNPRPRYPFSLLSMGVEGNVVVQFVVDSAGKADMRSLRVLRSTHELFTRAVRAVLPKLRFLPAEVAGSKVDVLVEQPFQFSVR